MSLLTSSIDLDMIVSPASQELSQFQSSQIEHLANLFLQAGGTVKPILLRRVSPISFEILEGYFEYYAALKAQEIDDQFTAIRAYVVPTDLESTILEQYNFLRSLDSSSSTEITSSQTSKAEKQDLAQMEDAIATRLEKKLSATIDRIVEERINASLQVFANQITQQLNSHLLDFKQSLSFVPISQVLETQAKTTTLIPELAPEKTVKSKTTKAAATTKSKTSSSKPKAKDKSINNNDPKVLQVLNDLNTMNFSDLERKLSQLKPSKRSLAKPIHEQRLQHHAQKFQSIEDVISKVSGIKEPTMQKIIDAW
ncbi:hypothetical protein PseudUWO311_00720 [Pseudanabaena sp. UWO311]|uniref:hypothetical protein n=1 Tax=Pseudanabaena sp. UWO311 TaxID=2487337 RepID=UPI00115BA222|nr:hypothetical protein [Pseudanabaena sp. UWO311]TYQ29451.1 hypothetical protein PseudUWO311_00720 [Pseudanabaena sp. UWO311]